MLEETLHLIYYCNGLAQNGRALALACVLIILNSSAFHYTVCIYLLWQYNLFEMTLPCIGHRILL